MKDTVGMMMTMPITSHHHANDDCNAFVVGDNDADAAEQNRPVVKNKLSPHAAVETSSNRTCASDLLSATPGL